MKCQIFPAHVQLPKYTVDRKTFAHRCKWLSQGRRIVHVVGTDSKHTLEITTPSAFGKLSKRARAAYSEILVSRTGRPGVAKHYFAKTEALDNIHLPFVIFQSTIPSPLPSTTHHSPLSITTSASFRLVRPFEDPENCDKASYCPTSPSSLFEFHWDDSDGDPVDLTPRGRPPPTAPWHTPSHAPSGLTPTMDSDPAPLLAADHWGDTSGSPFDLTPRRYPPPTAPLLPGLAGPDDPC